MMDGVATRGHAVVRLEGDRVLLIREVRSGRVNYLAPGVALRAGETPGRAAIRAAREQLGVSAGVTELLFADTEMGAEHFFFLADLESEYDPSWDLAPPHQDGTTAIAVRRSAIRAYPVRPVELARRLSAYDSAR